jgi:NADPH:quinone reductase-like Zn-dependent oxidoreductase
MRAAVFDRYGPADVLTITELPVPIPKPNEIRIKVHAAGVSAEDPKLRAFDHPPLFWLPVGLLFGFRRPRVRVLGMELAGEVDAVGPEVERFQVGDQVFGYTGIRHGAHAEYRCLVETGVLAHKPSNVDFAEAAALPNGALTALVYLRKLAKLEPGERVLVYGASGAVGTAAV